MREVRLAVMKSQFGWGVYAVCEYRAEERLGWYEGEEVTVNEWEGLGKREGREHTVRVSWAGNGRTPCINGIDGVAGMQYLNTAYGREEREKDTGVPEYTEKMTFKYNMRGGDSKVVVRVKKGQKVGAGDELRVAYGWTSKAWGRVMEEGSDGGHDERRRGWVEGDSRDVCYRGRLGSAYQADVGSEAEVGGEAEDGSTRVMVADLWKETRLGEPRGEVWEAGVGIGRREIQRQEWRGGRRVRPSDRLNGVRAGDWGEGGEAGQGTAEHEQGGDEEGSWLDDDWVVPQTAEEANEMWGTRGLTGWRRGQESVGMPGEGEDRCEDEGGNAGMQQEHELDTDMDMCLAHGDSNDGSTGPGTDDRRGPRPKPRPNPTPNDTRRQRGASRTIGKRRRSRARASDRMEGPADATQAAGEMAGWGGGRCGAVAQQRTASGGTEQQGGRAEAGASSACVDVGTGVADGQGAGCEGRDGHGAHGVAERGRKRRGTGECEGGAGAWRPCALGEVWVLGADARTSTREVRLAEVVAGRRRKRARCAGGISTTGGASQAQTCVESVSGLKRVAASEEGEEQRLQVIRQCDERMMEVREARRGYVQGSAWDEGNMIQAMARLRNPTIVWRYGDG